MSPATSGTLYMGCAIWAYDGWAGDFFPPGTPKDERLRAYAQRLSCVEGNTTFYAVPTVNAVRNWAAQTPETFRFSPKFPRAITHTAQLRDVAAQTGSFIGTMRLLGTRLGPLMIQLPPSFAPARLPLLRDYLESLPKDLQITVEVRHPDWFIGENGAKLDEALKATGAARVVFDVRPAHTSQSAGADSAKEKKPDVPLIAEATQPFVVLRYISSPLDAENEPYFQEWIPRLVNWLKAGHTIYVYIHCPVEERSPFIARALYQRVAAATKLPPLPWDALERPVTNGDFTQLSLF